MKKYLAIIASCVMMLGFTACGNTESGANDTTAVLSAESVVSDAASENISEENNEITDGSEQPADDEAAESTEQNDTSAETYETEASEADPQGAKQLVVYFSCTGNTKAVAERIAELCNADIYEIVPSEPYTADDIDYNQSDCRANLEMNDENARPAIGSETLDLSDYDTIYIGYPIWWGTMPRIINTFLDTYDLSDKTVMPFCTSGSSGISTSVSAIRDAEPNADVKDGFRAEDENDSGIDEWLENNN